MAAKKDDNCLSPSSRVTKILNRPLSSPSRHKPAYTPGGVFFTLGVLLAFAVVVALLIGRFSEFDPIAAQIALDDEAGKLQTEAEALFQDKRYAEAADLYENAAQAWRRSAEHSTDGYRRYTGDGNNPALMRIACLMTHMKHISRARAVEPRAKALYEQERYDEAVEAYGTAALNWRRAGEHSLDYYSYDGAIGYQSCMKNARLMACKQHFAEATAMERRAWNLSKQKRYWEAENICLQARQAWLVAAEKCDDAPTRLARERADKMAELAQQVNARGSDQRRSGR